MKSEWYDSMGHNFVPPGEMDITFVLLLSEDTIRTEIPSAPFDSACQTSGGQPIPTSFQPLPLKDLICTTTGFVLWISMGISWSTYCSCGVISHEEMEHSAISANPRFREIPMVKEIEMENGSKEPG